MTGIQATMLLNFVLKEIAPTAYNAGWRRRRRSSVTA
ncbi:MAG: hypothetical protein ACTHM9_03040 [Gemmatimonadales bacterium]